MNERIETLTALLNEVTAQLAALRNEAGQDDTTASADIIDVALDVVSPGAPVPTGGKLLPATIPAASKPAPIAITLAPVQTPAPAATGDQCMTFRQGFILYIKNHARPYLKSAAVIEARYKRYLQDFSKRRLNDITPLEVQQLHAELTTEVGKRTANHVVSDIQAVYNKLIDWGVYLGRNPGKGIVKHKLASRERFLQASEVSAFFDALRTLQSDTARDFCMLALLTGAREANLLSMRWDEIDFDLEVWRIPDHKTKTGTSYIVPLIPAAVAILNRRKETARHVYVFPGRYGKGHYANPHRAWKRICQAAGLQNLRIHDLRRSLASWQAITGADVLTIARTLGHADVKSTMVYARLNTDPVKAAMTKATAAMFDAAAKSRAQKSPPRRARKDVEF